MWAANRPVLSSLLRPLIRTVSREPLAACLQWWIVTNDGHATPAVSFVETALTNEVAVFLPAQPKQVPDFPKHFRSPENG